MSAESHRIIYGLRAINRNSPLAISAADEIERLLAMLEEMMLRFEPYAACPADFEAVARSRELIGAGT